jgi:nucleoside-diphosphate-sugar epimerase
MPRRAHAPVPDVLVAGGTGFVGATLARLALARTDARVWVLSRAHPPPFRHPRLRWRIHDLASPLDPLSLPRRVRWVVHCASPPADAPPDSLVQANVAGTVRLLDWAVESGARRFVYVSSGAAVGPRADPIAEDTSPAPEGAYGVAKLAGEAAVRAQAGRVPFAIARLFFPYGPGQRRGLLPQLCWRLVTGTPVEVGARGAPALNPIHVRDAARVLYALAAHEGPDVLVNVAGDERTDVARLARALAAELGRRPTFSRDAARRGHLLGRATAMRAFAEPTIPLARGLPEFARWWRSSRAE